MREAIVDINGVLERGGGPHPSLWIQVAARCPEPDGVERFERRLPEVDVMHPTPFITFVSVIRSPTETGTESFMLNWDVPVTESGIGEEIATIPDRLDAEFRFRRTQVGHLVELVLRATARLQEGESSSDLVISTKVTERPSTAPLRRGRLWRFLEDAPSPHCERLFLTGTASLDHTALPEVKPGLHEWFTKRALSRKARAEAEADSYL